MYINCVRKLKRCIRGEGKEIGGKGIYCGFSCLVNMCTEQNRIQVAVLAELGRIRWTWQNMAECGRLPSDCRRLPHIAIRLPSRGWSLLAASVETGRRV